jgi:hypothetical protein
MSLKRIATIAVLVSTLLTPALFAGIPGSSSESINGATVFNGALYVFFGTYYPSTDTYSNHYNSSFDGVSWAPAAATVPIPSGQYQTSALVPVAFNGRLYVFWHGWDSKSIYYISMDQFGVWDTVAKKIANASADREMNAIVFNNRLYVMWRATYDNTSLFYNSMSTTGTWGTNARLSTGESSDGPTAAILTMSDGVQYLYAYWKDRNDLYGDPMWYARMSAGSGWSSTTKLSTIDYPLTEERPAAVSDGNKIDLIYKGGYSDQYYIKEMSTTGSWTHERTIPVYSGSGPTAIRFNGATWIFDHLDSTDNYEITTYTYY